MLMCQFPVTLHPPTCIGCITTNPAGESHGEQGGSWSSWTVSNLRASSSHPACRVTHASSSHRCTGTHYSARFGVPDRCSRSGVRWRLTPTVRQIWATVSDGSRIRAWAVLSFSAVRARARPPIRPRARAGLRPFADQTALVLGQGAEDLEDQPAHVRRRVHLLGQRRELHVVVPEAVDKADQVLQVATEAVQAPDDERVAGPHATAGPAGPRRPRSRNRCRCGCVPARSRPRPGRRAADRGIGRGWRRGRSRTRCA